MLTYYILEVNGCRSFLEFLRRDWAESLATAMRDRGNTVYIIEETR